jgi:hypothetical protein
MKNSSVYFFINLISIIFNTQNFKVKLLHLIIMDLKHIII